MHQRLMYQPFLFHPISLKRRRTVSVWLSRRAFAPNAAHCNALQHTATYCQFALSWHTEHPAVHCSTMRRTARHCNTLQHTHQHVADPVPTCLHDTLITLQHSEIRSTLQHIAIHCNTLQHIADSPTYDNVNIPLTEKIRLKNIWISRSISFPERSFKW